MITNKGMRVKVEAQSVSIDDQACNRETAAHTVRQLEKIPWEGEFNGESTRKVPTAVIIINKKERRSGQVQARSRN
jgi:hypothetical protein